MFLPAEKALSREACEATWNLYHLFMQQWVQISSIISSGKVNVAQARALQAEDRGHEVVWISEKVFKHWQSMVASATQFKGIDACELAAFKAFLDEVHSTRWRSAFAADQESGSSSDQVKARD